MITASLNDWFILAGRLHPLIVHLPIGILILAAIFEMLVRVRRFAHLKSALPATWLAGVASSLLACATGLMLAGENGYDDSTLQTHQWLGIAVAVLSAIGFALRSLPDITPAYPVALSVLILVFISLTGHFGGALTHGEDYLIEPLSRLFNDESDRDTIFAAKPIAITEEAVVYHDIIQPIMEEKCMGCHNAEKRKGKLNLEEYTLMLKGGKSGPSLVPGSADESELFQRLLLPRGDKKRMPPKNKPQLSKDERNLIQWWIQEAKASATMKVNEVQAQEKVKGVLASLMKADSLLDGEVASPPEIPESDLNAVSAAQLDSLERAGFVVTRIAGSPFLSVNCVNSEHFGDKEIALLLSVRDHVLWLNVNNTKLTDSGMMSIGQFRNLTRLSLTNTRITDQGMTSLQDLGALRYLNLVGTGVTDRSAATLSTHRNLRALYLWRTGISAQGMKIIRDNISGIEVNGGEVP